jgi:ribosomal protein S12 methylthiotransferase
MEKKIHFISLGCARNLVDTEVMIGLSQKTGYSVTPSLEQADYVVINTCGFLKAARDEAYQHLQEITEKKKKSAKIIVAGCMVRLNQQELKERFPEIHYFVSAGDVDKIVEALESQESGAFVGDAKSFLQLGEIPRTVSTPKHYAYLKIAEGCKKQCSFCIIPTIKGKLKSKPIEQVVREFNAFIDSGVKEVILIAQDLGDYGKDLGMREGLASLLTALLEKEGDYWIRLLYLYPDEITPAIVSLLEKDGRIIPYLDMPIQHINSEVLKRMHRKTSKEDIVTTLAYLRDKIPDVVIRTSLMVGFPGETEEQFLELVEFVEKSKLDNVGIFQYSKEEESYSAKLEGHLPDSIKQERFDALSLVQQRSVEENQKKYIGKLLKVLIDGKHPESDRLLVGRFYGQCPEIDGCVILNDWRKVKGMGEFVLVEITDAVGYDLIGKAIKTLSGKEKSSLSLLY